MAEEVSPLSLWARRGLYLGASLVLILAALVPLSAVPRALPPPEALLVLTLAWVARRPAEVPPAAIAGVFLLADLLLMRPPGLHAFLVLAAAEWLRWHPARTASFPAEWARAAGAVLVVAAAEQAILTLTLAGAPPAGPALARALLTALSYPLAALVAGVILGARAPRPARVKERPA